MCAEIYDIAGNCLSEATIGAAPRSAIPIRGAADRKTASSSRAATHYDETERVHRSSPASYVEPEIDDIPFLNNIVLALKPE